ncbi:uncharacterized protein PRCAT00006000001 [Priceomyces carsonii]|uniref:uncharacterized protein n=1 Tax=Priceomyces carsonii TaxID=28549 RepID=UPI002EDB99BC|nr:unnamed protein product [Priceomyces carsonii]
MLCNSTLELIRFVIKINIVAVCTFPVFDPENMKEDIIDCTSKVRDVLDSNAELSQESELLLSEINKLTKFLHLMVAERAKLQQEINNFISNYFGDFDYRITKEGVFYPKDSSTLNKSIAFHSSHKPVTEPRVFNGVSQKGKRISKDKLDILEKWFDVNQHHPYLTQGASLNLVSRTGLSYNQVRNWISNKRRKEKTCHVSKELKELLS